MRWSRVGVGSLDKLNQEKVNQAWKRVYGVWAWSTSLKETVENQVIFNMKIPEDVDSYLGLIDYPKSPSVSELRKHLGYEQKSGTDIMARQNERLGRV